MLFTKLIRQTTRQKPLYFILVISFVVQSSATVGLTTWLFYHWQQKNIAQVTTQLETETINNLEQRLRQELTIPQQVNQVIFEAIALNPLNFAKPEFLKTYLQRQLETWPSWQSFQIKLASGETILIQRNAPSHNIIISQQSQVQFPLETTWQLNLEKSHLTLIQPISTPENPQLATLTTEISLTKINEILQQNNRLQTGSFLILDRQGKIILENQTNQTPPKLITQLQNQIGSFHQVTTTQQHQIKIENQEYLILIKPFKEQLGIDWLLVLPLPKSTLKNLSPYYLFQLIIVIIFAIAIAITLAKITAIWINEPILKLIQASQALSQGRWNPTLLIEYQEDLGTCQETVKLVETFNQMRTELHDSFLTVERAKVELETRIEERTKAIEKANQKLREEIRERQQTTLALRHSEAKFRHLFENSQVGIFRVSLENDLFLEINQRGLEIFGYSEASEIVEKKQAKEFYLDPKTYQESVDILKQKGEITNIELQLRRASNQIIWVLFSANLNKKQGYLEGVITDISDRKQVEETLKETQITLRQQNNILLTLAKNKTLYQGDLEIAFNTFTETTAEILGVERVGIWLYNEEHSILECFNMFEKKLNQHFQESPLKAEDYPFYFQAIESDRFIAVNNVLLDPRTQELVEHYFKPLQIVSLLDSPIRLGGQIVGLLCLESRDQPRKWSLESQNFAASLADLISLAIEAQRNKKTELALRKRERQYRDLVQTVNCIIIRIDPIGNITFINEYGQNFFGYSEPQLLNQNVIGTLIKDNKKTRKYLTFLIKDISKRPHRYLRYEMRHIREDGQKVWVSWANRPIFDEQGQLIEILSVGTDLTDRKRAEESLKEKEEYLRIILDNIPQQVFWKNTDLIFLGCNKNWAEAAYLKSPEEVIGKTDFELLSDPNAAEFFRQQDRKIIDNNIPQLHFVAKKQRPAPDGSPVWLDISKIPIHDSKGKVIGIVGVLEDITERKLAEEALNAEQEKSEALLLNILPKAIAEQLKRNQKEHIAEHFDQITILFADIVGFTPISSRMSPKELVSILNEIFSIFDQLAEQHRLEKIKTIGDAYMIVGGLPVAREDHAEAIAKMAIDMIEAVNQFQHNSLVQNLLQIQHQPTLEIRIGINTGSVVAGVIGIKKFSYDLWGDTVNIASRMESQGEPGKIQVTATTYEQLKDKFIFEERGEIEVKGKGKMTTYWLLGKQTYG
jgi:PAS domain S-box-containing protein